jgi:hypothetical protein
MRRLVTGLNPGSVAAKNKLVTGRTLILPTEATVRTALLRSDLGISEAADLLGVAPAGTETDSSTWVHYP